MMAHMPELPEVETIARQLAPLLVGRRVRDLTVLDPRLRTAPALRLAGRKIEAVSRSGKRVLVRFSGARAGKDPLWLTVHLRMTGRLIWLDAGSRLDRAHLRARMRLDRGALAFYDTRRFGTFEWFRSAEAARPDGIDPLSAELTPVRLRALFGTSRQGIKPWLLRQDRLVGLGNIYASEILHAARIAPGREVRTLDEDESSRLCRAMRAILRRAIRACGTTFSDFQDSHGEIGSYQRFLAVYDREGEPCPRCRRPVVREVQQQRSTFWCQGCQR